MAHKLSVIRSLTSRAESLLTDSTVRKTEIAEIKSQLLSNGYPSDVFDSVCRRSTDTINMSRVVEEPAAVVSIPYISNTSEAIRRVLSKVNIRCAFKPQLTLRNCLVKPKDQIPQQSRSNVVYSIPCTRCPKLYIGESKRSLKTRITEHKRALRQGDSNSSAPAEHAMVHNHPIDWDNASVIDSNTFYYPRKYLEAWHIRTLSRTNMNRDVGNLPPVYNRLINSK